MCVWQDEEAFFSFGARFVLFCARRRSDVHCSEVEEKKLKGEEEGRKRVWRAECWCYFFLFLTLSRYPGRCAFDRSPEGTSSEAALQTD